jgi:hypothetical protein
VRAGGWPVPGQERSDRSEPVDRRFTFSFPIIEARGQGPAVTAAGLKSAKHESSP